MHTTLSPEQIDALLARQHYAHLGTAASGQVYVVPITYLFNDDNVYVYGYTHEGKKISMMRRNPEVCVQVEEVKDHSEWESAIAWGTFEEVTDHEEQQRIRLLFAEQFAEGTGKKHEVLPLIEDNKRKPGDIVHPVLYRIRIHTKTGRAERPNSR